MRSPAPPPFAHSRARETLPAQTSESRLWRGLFVPHSQAIKNYWNSRTFQAKIASTEARMAEHGTRRPLQIPVGDAPSSPKDGSAPPSPRQQQLQQQGPATSASRKGGAGGKSGRGASKKKLEGDAAKGKENTEPQSQPTAPSLVLDSSASSDGSSHDSLLPPTVVHRTRPGEFMEDEQVLAESDGAWYEATVLAVKEPAQRQPGAGFYFVHYAAWDEKYDEWLCPEQVRTEMMRRR